ncbi:MAG: hypothetical protein SVR81_00545 [Chloroflexota bacterium]|nr:hypothetical protein [Chloroflexota bacterium]
MARTILITLALRYAQACFVQSINLFAPFMVVFFDRVINRTALPKIAMLAMMLCTVGGVLLIFSRQTAQRLSHILRLRIALESSCFSGNN